MLVISSLEVEYIKFVVILILIVIACRVDEDYEYNRNVPISPVAFISLQHALSNMSFSHAKSSVLSPI